MSAKSTFESCSVLKNISLPSSGVALVDDIEKENIPFAGYDTIGGVLSDTKYVWYANGPHFTLFNSKNGFKIASWSFGLINKAVAVKITCVEELLRQTGRLPLLIIGLECDSHGQICVFDFTTSRILRCIDVDHRVTSLAVIDPNYDISLLTKSLCTFDGIVAVGMSNGHLYLIDICRLNCEEVLLHNALDVRDEINACTIEILYPDELNLQRRNGSINEKHLCIHLNAVESNTEHFVLKGPKGDNRIFVNKEEVVVSALHYSPQLGALLVGYNFGAWQLWNLIDFQLIYTSPVYEENIPVSHFAVQEPCDDPRAFCYVWAVYSYTEPYQSGLPVAVLYSLNYESKGSHKGYGILYRNLSTCSVRFQTELSVGDYNETGSRNDGYGANCLCLQAITKSFLRNSSLNNQDETVTVCSMVWRSWSLKNPSECKTYLSLFDLNQWYKEQMPSFLNKKNCDSYISRVCLSDILNSNNTLKMLDVRINIESLSQFLGAQKLEEHYHPSSLAFQTYALSTNCITIFENKGNQRALTSGLEYDGPSTVLKPTEPFLLAIDLGLTPLFIDVPSKTTTLDFQREFLLSVGLEQQLLGWLCKCVTVWSSGIYASLGCNLNFLLSWGWQRTQTLKENVDKLSVSLFDHSGLRLDANTHNLLNHCSRQLKNLSTLFKFVVRKFLGFVLNPDMVKDQSQCLEMISVHLEVLHWLLNVGLLPECPLSSYPRIDELNRISAPYPAQKLINYFSERRMDLNMLINKKFSTSESILFIDNLLEQECGGHRLQKQWEDDGGSGTYPPPSLQALMRTYLVENVDLLYKHCVVVYLFLDLTMVLDANRYKSTITHLIKFPSVFHLSPSIIKIVQSFWQLDHGDFKAAIEHLLDPMISANDLKLWHHRVALKALLAQEQYNFALLYLQVRRPAVTEVHDLCTILSLYVANNMIDEAFHFQRQHHNFDIASKLLHHFYKECDKVGNIKSILFLPLRKEEEEAFMKYLKDVSHPQCNDLQIYYYTQHSRYVDAMDINDHVNPIKIASRGLHGQQVLTDTDYIISRLAFISNPLSRSIMDQCKRKEINSQPEVTRPQPFSVFVHNTEEQIKYKSSLIAAGMLKAKETWSHPILNRSSIKGKANEIAHGKNEDIPFLSTPTATLPQSRVLTPLIYPKLINVNNENNEEPPAKKFKPLSRLTMTSLDNSRQNLEITCKKLSVTLDTPIVKRKSSRGLLQTTDQNNSIDTPHSILKSQILANSSEVIENVQSNDITDAYTLNVNRRIASLRQTSLGATPRKPLTHTSRPAVRFSLSRTPSQSSDCSELDFVVIQEKAVIHSPLEGLSANNEEKCKTNNDNYEVPDKMSHTPEPPQTPRSRRSYKEHISAVEIRSSPRLRKLKESFNDASFETKDNTVSKLSELREKSVNVENESCSVSNETVSPLSTRRLRSRKSYKDNLSEEAVKSSPRGKMKRSNDEAFKLSEEDTSLFGKSKIESRRSLSRMVLENNTFSNIVELSTSVTSKTLTYASTFSDEFIEENEEKKSPVDVTDTHDHSEINSIKETSSVMYISENFTGAEKDSAEKRQEIEESVEEDNEPMEYETCSIGNEEDEKPTFDKSNENSSSFSLALGKSEEIEETVKEGKELIENEACNIGNEEEGNVSNKIVFESDEDTTTSTIKLDNDNLFVDRGNEVDEKDVDNIYDDLSNDGNYESADPEMNVFEISDDLNLNEAICASNVNTLEVETNSNYSANGAEVFADESDVLNVVPVEESSSDQPESSIQNDLNKTMLDADIAEAKDESAIELSYSSPSSVEVVEVSSGSNEENSESDNSSDSLDGLYSEESNISYTSSLKLINKDIATDDYFESDSNSSVNSKDGDSSNSAPLEVIEEESSETSSPKVSDDVIQLDVISEEELEMENILTESMANIENKEKPIVCNEEEIGSAEIDDGLKSSTNVIQDHTTLTTKPELSTPNVCEQVEKKDSSTSSSEYAVVTLTDTKSIIPKATDHRVPPEMKTNNGEIVSVAIEVKEKPALTEKKEDTSTSYETSKMNISCDQLAVNIESVEGIGKSNAFHNTNISADKNLFDDSINTNKETEPAHLFENNLFIDSTPTLSAPRSLIQNVSFDRDVFHKMPMDSIFSDSSINLSNASIGRDSFDNSVNFHKKGGSSEVLTMTNAGSSLFVENTPHIPKNRKFLHNLNQLSGSGKVSRDFLATFADQRKTTELSDSCVTPQQIDTLTKGHTDDVKDQNIPARRSKRLSSLQNQILSESTETRKYTFRKRSFSIPEQNNSVEFGESNRTLSKTLKGNTPDPIPAKRKRTLSVDVMPSPFRRRGLRSNSVDIPLLSAEQSGSKKVNTVQSVKSNKSEQSNVTLNKQTKPRKSKSDIVSNKTNVEQYSSTRRLTRRQADLLKKTLGSDNAVKPLSENASSSSDSEPSDHRGPEIPEIDAIHLLDKQPFEGKPDSDEELIHKSPVSSIEESPSSHLRTISSLSNTSPQTSIAKNKRIAKRIFSEASSSKQINDVPVEAQSKSETVVKKTRKRRSSKESETSAISQTRSLSEIKNVGRVTRRTRSIAEESVQPLRKSQRQAKSDLPKITEEQDIVGTQKRKGKKKK